jgi:hypothetical protein
MGEAVVRLVDSVPMPPRVARLPRNSVGYPIPYFVATLEGGVRDFRVASAERFAEAYRGGLCYVCGGRRGTFSAFTIGPMCAVNRISSEPPAHRDCAIYSARVCPFLSNPLMRRRPVGEGFVQPAGEMLLRNPGVALVWMTRWFRVVRPPQGMGQDGILFDLGEPTEALWFAQGRPATRAEVVASIESGMPALEAACDSDDDPADSRRNVAVSLAAAMRLVPAG